MEIIRDIIPEMTIEEFADKHCLTMSVVERREPSSSAMRYHASFRGCEIKDGPCLIGAYGDGATQGEAIENYRNQISLKLLVFNAYTENRQEILAPRIVPKNVRSGVVVESPQC